MESSGQTGAEPFGKHALVCTAIGAPRKEDEQARAAAEARYLDVTGLALIESTGPPATRPGQWSSVGMGLLKMKGWKDEGPIMWQFERKDSADGFGPGWHNYQPDPKTGVDSVKIVEQLYQQHRHWGGGKTGTRSVASGRFSYALNFVAGTDGVQHHGEQTNTQTNVKRAVRRVPVAQACKCQACTQPRAPSRPASAPARATVPPPPAALRPDAPPQGGGGNFEQQLKALLVSGDNGLPRCWTGQKDVLITVPSGSPEFLQVKGHLLHSLNAGGGVQIGKILRVQNAAVYKATRRDASSENLMFHGCKSTENENSIVQGGFSVAKCVSGGAGHGTWFAYNSSYSDGSFAFNDAMGWRHLFVCVVSKHGLKKDDATTMRVVGQGGAYPQWIVHYRHGP